MSDPNEKAMERWFGRQHGNGEPPYDGGMEARVTALEAKWDAVIPTLATKADVAEIRGDVQKAVNSTERWMIATVLTVIGTVVLGFTALFFNLSSGLSKSAAAPAPPPIIINVPAAQAPAASK